MSVDFAPCLLDITISHNDKDNLIMSVDFAPCLLYSTINNRDKDNLIRYIYELA